MVRYYDSSLFQATSKIIFLKNEKDYMLVCVEDTIFYPGGGGQPCDTGVIENNKFRAEVIDVFKENNKILHKLKVVKGNLSLNDEVVLKIDKEKREILTKMHTAEHIFFKSLKRFVLDLRLKKINLGVKESSLFVEAQDLNWDILFKAEDLANNIIKKDLPVIEHNMSKQDAVNLKKLRIKLDRIKSDKIRVIEVKDFDWSACMGCHVSSTAMIRNIIITGFHHDKSGYEIRFKADSIKDVYELSKISRKVSFFLSTKPSLLLDKIRKIIQEFEQYKEKFREVSLMLLNNYDKKKIKNTKFFYAIVDDVEKKQLIDKSNKLLKEKTVVCFISRQNDKSIVMVNRSDDLKLNISELLRKILSKFNGKGGGKDNFAMGSFDKGKEKEFLELLKQELNNSFS